MTARIIAYFNDGTAAYVSRSRKDGKGFTTRKNQSWVMPVAEAEETVARFHAVQAQGHYHQDVNFYAVGPIRRPARQRTAGVGR